MKNIIELLKRHFVFVFFLILFIFSLVVLFSSNRYHNASFVSQSKDWVGKIYEWRDQLQRYLRLKEINDQLALENANLRSQLPENYFFIDTTTHVVQDSIRKQRYYFRSAKVSNASVNRESNYLTLDRGRLGGILPNMGVITNGSVVGVVSSVSDHFSVVLPILNPKFQESVKMKGSGDFGLIAWPPGSDPAYADVKDIPKHVQVSIGDTVLTTGYGSHFPADLYIGFVSELNDQPEENFHRIKIQLATDFRKLSHVQVVSDILKQEQDSLLIQQQQRDGVEDNN